MNRREFTKNEIEKMFDLLTDFSEDKKKELIEKYWSWDSKHLRDSWLDMCLTTKMCNKLTVIRANQN